jgi:hypothetical protein
MEDIRESRYGHRRDPANRRKKIPHMWNTDLMPSCGCDDAPKQSAIIGSDEAGRRRDLNESATVA